MPSRPVKTAADDPRVTGHHREATWTVIQTANTLEVTLANMAGPSEHRRVAVASIHRRGGTADRDRQLLDCVAWIGPLGGAADQFAILTALGEACDQLA